MQFRKISDTKIHCVISQEEMWEKGIEIDDFLDHREKTEEFLREILAEAKYELDLEDMGHYFSVQMSVMPEGDVSLVISGEKSNDVQGALAEFGKKLQDFKEIMSAAKKQLEQKKQEEQQSVEADAKQDEPEQTEAMEEVDQPEKNGTATPDVLQIPVWVKVASMEDCIRLSQMLLPKLPLESALYKYRDSYYWRLIFLQEEHQVAGMILVVSEFAGEVFTEDQGGGVISEHGQCILKKEAVETLASL